jgi:hypothetical protein
MDSYNVPPPGAGNAPGGPVSEATAAGPITLHGELNVRDLRRLFYFGMFCKPFWIVFLAVVLLTPIALAVVALSGGASRISILLNASPFVILFVFWIGTMAVMPRRSAAKRFKTERYWREPATYEFQQEAIRIVRPSESSVMKWTLVTAVRETRSLFLIEIGETAIPLPKRFFADAGQAEEWKTLVLSQVKSQKQIGVKGLAARCC